MPLLTRASPHASRTVDRRGPSGRLTERQERYFCDAATRAFLATKHVLHLAQSRRRLDRLREQVSTQQQQQHHPSSSDTASPAHKQQQKWSWWNAHAAPELRKVAPRPGSKHDDDDGRGGFIPVAPAAAMFDSDSDDDAPLRSAGGPEAASRAAGSGGNGSGDTPAPPLRSWLATVSANASAVKDDVDLDDSASAEHGAKAEPQVPLSPRSRVREALSAAQSAPKLGETRDTFVKRRGRELNALVRACPREEEAWLALVAFHVRSSNPCSKTRSC